MDILDRLLAHNAWTTGRLIEQSRILSDDQLDQNFDIGFRTVRATWAMRSLGKSDLKSQKSKAPLEYSLGAQLEWRFNYALQ